MRFWSCTFAILGLSMALCCAPAPAASFDFDFDDDEGPFEYWGTAEWREENGFNNSGYLNITDAANDQRGAIVFPDLEDGQSLTAFHITADLRVGGGTSTNPADGFSFNFARPGDPVLDDGEDWASSPTGEANLPEEGTTTGLAIGFDEWFSGGADVIGMSVRIDNEIVNEFSFPNFHGDADDQTSLQTGPQNVFEDDLQEEMGWARLEMRLCPALDAGGLPNVYVEYKGVQVFNQDVEYDPSPGLLVFGGRTGGSNAYHHIDNLSVRTGDDVGDVCAVFTPWYVGGQGTIGTRTEESERQDPVYGPPDGPEPGLLQEWFGTANPGNKGAIDAIFNTSDPMVPPFRAENGATWWTGSQAPIGDLVSYPDEVQPPFNDTGNDNYVVRATGEILIPEPGTYRFADGVDDFCYLAIDLDKSGIAGDDPVEVLIEDNTWTNPDRSANGGGLGWAEVDIDDVAAEGEWLAIEFNMGEGGGGDHGVVHWDYDPDAPEGQRLGGQENFPEIPEDPVYDPVDAETVTFIPDTHLRSVIRELISADLVASITTTRPLEFDVNGDTDEADQVVVENPNPEVFTTILDVDGATFQIAATGEVASGEAFVVVDADQIAGTPTITSVDAGQNWAWDGATGRVCLDACPGGSIPGDHDGSGVLDAADLDLQAVEMQKPVGEQDLAEYDLDNSGAVDFEDRKFWVGDLKKTWIGDANLDLEFNSGDMVQVFSRGKYETGETAGWEDGDWNGDTAFGSGDMVAAFVGGGYEKGQLPVAASAVPEPSSIVLVLIGLAGLIGLARRR